jgi:hypothetical protein
METVLSWIHTDKREKRNDADVVENHMGNFKSVVHFALVGLAVIFDTPMQEFAIQISFCATDSRSADM